MAFYENKIGFHETHVLGDEEEADQNRLLLNCKKNPGHGVFTPVESFSLYDLPRNYRDNDLLDLIKAAADMTVRVDVKKTSPDRPQFWPGTYGPYPFYTMRGKTHLRMGSGRVKWVYKHTDVNSIRVKDEDIKCLCVKCQHKPSNVVWELIVDTATHVVFDDVEARHTTLRLFYDSDDDSSQIILDSPQAFIVNVERDWCSLRYVTCAKELGEKLYQIKENLVNVWSKVYYKYRLSREDDRLAFIVSHPHGCPKQISFGQWIQKRRVGDNFVQFTYTVATCPGSSGATVYCLGFRRWSYLLIHSGATLYGLNFSGNGYVK
ncbi:hypothetical protein BgiBS90_020459 [Biomphalaria glabrata]|nr:hypothetical protein BgiBS90_020459 [Biomphalaria glabrata]